MCPEFADGFQNTMFFAPTPTFTALIQDGMYEVTSDLLKFYLGLCIGERFLMTFSYFQILLCQYSVGPLATLLTYILK